MGLKDLSLDDFYKSHGYFKGDNRIAVDTCFINEESQIICVTGTFRMDALKDLVSNHKWNCIFDEGTPDDQSVFTCLTHGL